MQISFAGEAYETFQRIVDSLQGLTINLTIAKPGGRVGESVSFDALLLGADHDSEWGDAVLYRVYDEERGEPTGGVESARAEKIEVY